MQKVILIFSIIILVFLAGCTGVPGGKSYTEQECEDKVAEAKGNCYRGFAVQDRDLGYCEKIEYRSIKESCVSKTNRAKTQYCTSQAQPNPTTIGEVCPTCCADSFPGDQPAIDICTSDCIGNSVANNVR